VDHAVEAAAEVVGERVEVFLVAHVELDDLWFRRQPARSGA
jgi:hypothetical protein